MAELMGAALREVELAMMRRLSPTVNLYEFRLVDGLPLAGFEPGSHIDLHLSHEMIRQYSLIDVRHDALQLAVQREANGRGASKYLHDSARLGQRFQVGPPRNHFALSEHAPHSVFIAGGIGITPILPMLAFLGTSKRLWELHYASRQSPPPFLELLEGYGDRVSFWTGAGNGDRTLDIDAVVRDAPDGAVFYCCGPQRMLDHFERATAALPDDRVRIERFGSADDPSLDGGFVVTLQRSGRSVRILPGQTILQALADAGMHVPNSCQEGVCGACETRVLRGRPDHRDSILSAAERAANKSMMVCCSGSLDTELVLDL